MNVTRIIHRSKDTSTWVTSTVQKILNPGKLLQTMMWQSLLITMCSQVSKLSQLHLDHHAYWRRSSTLLLLWLLVKLVELPRNRHPHKPSVQCPPCDNLDKEQRPRLSCKGSLKPLMKNRWLRQDLKDSSVEDIGSIVRFRVGWWTASMFLPIRLRIKIRHVSLRISLEPETGAM